MPATASKIALPGAEEPSETSTRNTLDINAIPVVKELSHLPYRSGSQPCHRKLEVG